ncbi:hypothetical protein CYA_1115 [Synechococcus sp. JA-3-3Ab]|nr:hypothetical protein CYA_1115 [Synechococcus sp. JA-3-3Ab]
MLGSAMAALSCWRFSRYFSTKRWRFFSRSIMLFLATAHLFPQFFGFTRIAGNNNLQQGIPGGIPVVDCLPLRRSSCTGQVEGGGWPFPK